MRRSVVFFTVCAAMTATSLAGTAAQVTPAAHPPPAPVSDYRFHGTRGLLVFHVRSEHVSNFEDVMGRIRAGLAATTNEVRRDQAAGWRVFRSADTATGAVYVVVIDPLVQGADYDPVKMLTELAPDNTQALYERLRNAVIRVERLDLEPIP